MAFIRFVNLEGQFHTFPQALDLNFFAAEVAAVAPYRPYSELLEYMESHQGDIEVLTALRNALNQPAGTGHVRVEEKAEKLARRAAHLEADLRAITSSRSWRLTVPLRQLAVIAARSKRTGEGT